MKNNKGIIFYLLLVIVLFALGLGITYWIAESSLPMWVKFLLLR